MADIQALQVKVTERFAHLIESANVALGELTVVLTREHLVTVATALRDEVDFAFDLLVDVCGVDYLHYGIGEWETESATRTGFERGVDASLVEKIDSSSWGDKPRFAAVYHLLSLTQNHRIRLRVLLSERDLVMPSVVDIWPAANWFEREAFDLYGIVFVGHPDLRRILTDYGFVGYPFRKDFPLSGNVEVRYDANAKRVVYEPVSIPARILEPKVIRRDNRYRLGE